MSDTMDRLKSEVLALPVSDRAELASCLLASLDDDEDEEEDVATLEAALAEVLKRRFEEMKSGRDKGIPGDEVMEKMRRK